MKIYNPEPLKLIRVSISKAKEEIIKELANKYKDKLSLEVYESLINFKINNYVN